MMNSPLHVSVIMPSFNQARFISEAIESVLAQDHETLELIVSDGGSSDGTVDILKSFAARDRRLQWVSEPDDGPAPALNKALEKAQGAIVGWLNSDDRYLPGAIGRAVRVFEANQNAMLVYGHGDHIDVEGAVLGPYPTKEPSADLGGFAAGSYICQPTAFFKWIAYKLIGPLDETYSAAFDFDYWVRFFSSFQGRVEFVDAVQAQSRLYDDCITMRSRKQVALEGMRVCAKYFNHAEIHWLSTYFEEVARQSDAERGFADFRTHASEVLSEAAPYLSHSNLERMREQLDSFPSP